MFHIIDCIAIFTMTIDKGKTVTVKVTDRCGGCKGKHDLDLSPAAFAKLADPKEGRLHGIEWHWQ